MSLMSTIDVSSNTNTSPGTGFSALYVNSFVCGLYLRRRCTVTAGAPVDSVMRFAARPVGAASRTLIAGLPPTRRAP